MNFKQLVQEYSAHVTNLVVMTAHYGDSVPIQDMVLLDKVEKHYREGNIRDVAIYIAGYIEGYTTSLPERVRDIAHKLGLKRGPLGVGYPHSDGTYHWFHC